MNSTIKKFKIDSKLYHLNLFPLMNHLNFTHVYGVQKEDTSTKEIAPKLFIVECWTHSSDIQKYLQKCLLIPFQ